MATCIWTGPHYTSWHQLGMEQDVVCREIRHWMLQDPQPEGELQSVAEHVEHTCLKLNDINIYTTLNRHPAILTRGDNGPTKSGFWWTELGMKSLDGDNWMMTVLTSDIRERAPGNATGPPCMTCSSKRSISDYNWIVPHKPFVNNLTYEWSELGTQTRSLSSSSIWQYSFKVSSNLRPCVAWVIAAESPRE